MLYELNKDVIVKKNKVLVIGYFGYKINQLDGQTVKTRSLFELCSQKFGNVTFYDTYLLRVEKKSLFGFFKKLIHAEVVIFLPGINGLSFFGSLLLLMKAIKGIKIYYFVVGGWLPDLVKNNRFFRFMVQRFDAVFLETQEMVKRLQESCSNEVAYFPNFRWKEKVEINPNPGGSLRVVAMSRIIAEKGMETLLELAEMLHKENAIPPVSIDIYGPTFDDYGQEFIRRISGHQVIKYRGILEPKEIISRLKCYDLFLFPTYYEGEGFPGALVDAFLSGLPVLATDWKYNAEILEHGETGFLFPIKDTSELYRLLCLLNNDRSLLQQMKQKALVKGDEFTDVKASGLLDEYIQL